MAPNKSAKNGTASHHNNNNNNNNNSTTSGSTTSKKKQQQPQKQIKIKKPKNRDSDCCSINFIKYVLIIIDIIFFVSWDSVNISANISTYKIVYDPAIDKQKHLWCDIFFITKKHSECL